MKAVTETSISNAEELCQRGIELLAAGNAGDAAEAFRAAIAADSAHFDAHHGLVRALRDAGRLEHAVGAALALTALTPGDPLAHTALSISLQAAGHVPEAEAAAARARVLEWKIQLLSPPDGDRSEPDEPRKEPLKEPPDETPPLNDPPPLQPPDHEPPAHEPPIQEPPAEDSQT